MSNLEQQRTLQLQTEETKLQVSKLILEQNKLAEITKAQVDFEKSQIQMKQENMTVEAKAIQGTYAPIVKNHMDIKINFLIFTANLKVKYEVENKNAMNLLAAQNKLEVAKLEAEAKRLLAETDREIARATGELYQGYLSPLFYFDQFSYFT